MSMKLSVTNKSMRQIHHCSYAGLLLFSMTIAALFQLVCSKNSPLYPTNDWVDVNCFSTVGKSILDGKILYRDIYEQKGPYLYFIYAVVNLISSTSFVGAFLIHIVTMGLFLYFSARIMQLLINDDWFVLISIILLALVIHTCKAFAHGGSVEELLLWMISASMFILIRVVLECRTFSRYECFLIGTFVSFTLLTKFTILGFYLGVIMFVLIWYLKNRKYKHLFNAILHFMLGLIVVSLPVLLYFVINDAIYEFWEVYFYNNIFIYGTPGFSNHVLANLPNAIVRIVQIAYGVLRVVYNNIVFALLITVGFLFLILKKGFSSMLRLAVILSFCLLIVGIYWGKYYVYYSMPLAVFAVFGLCAIYKKCTINFRPAISIVLIVALVLSFLLSGNTYFIKYEKEDLVTYRFAEKINKVENATLLEYNCLDSGFYHAAGIIPNCKFFCELNIKLPEQTLILNDVIENGSVDFVILRDKMLDSPLYSCIDSANHFFEGEIHTYYLYQLNPDI